MPPRARRRLVPALVAAWALAVPVSAQGADPGAWSRDQQRAVLDAGLMKPLAPGRFGGSRPLTAAQMRHALDGLSARQGARRAAVPAAGPISVAAFHRILVGQLGLLDVAHAVQRDARRAGLQPPERFGTEVVARLLELRFNHPAAHDARELYPWEPITRAEAAWSLARVHGLGAGEAARVREVLGDFSIPRMKAERRRALRIAVSRIGMPYVWGGETDRPSTHLGRQVRGGYDCSGLAWRVFKLSGLPAGRRIRGRTAAQQAGEIPRSQRLPLDRIHPGDLLFFGPAGFGDRATEHGIDHMGIALSRDFMIHASRQGVYVSSLAGGWHRRAFSWGRRVL